MENVFFIFFALLGQKMCSRHGRLRVWVLETESKVVAPLGVPVGSTIISKSLFLKFHALGTLPFKSVSVVINGQLMTN